MEFLFVIYVMNESKLLSHMDQISQHNNYTNHQIHSYDQMSKMIVTLESKKVGNMRAAQLSYFTSIPRSISAPVTFTR